MRRETGPCQWYEEPLHVQVLMLALAVLVLVVAVPIALLGIRKVVETYRGEFELCGRYDTTELLTDID